MKIPSILLCSALCWVAGCSFVPRLTWHYQEGPVDATKQVNIKKSLQYANDLLAIEAAQQKVVCERIKSEHARFTNKKNRLNLAFSIVLIPDCGHDVDALNLFTELIEDLDDQSVKQMLVVMSELLERNIRTTISAHKLHEKVNLLSEQAKQLQEDRDTVQTELQTLRSKLEELKLIEQTLNKP